MKSLKYIFVILFFTFLLQISGKSQIVIIVHKDNPIGDLSVDQVKDYYLRKSRSRWAGNNQLIKPVDRRGSTQEKDLFLSNVLGMSNEKLSQYFTQRQFANLEPPPKKFGSNQEVLEYISGETGAIGFVDKATYDSNTSKVKSVYIAK